MRTVPSFVVAIIGAAIPVLTAYPAPKTGTTCNITFDGSEFLSFAAQRGIEVMEASACYQVSLSNNAFYAHPDSVCELRFPNSDWLVDGARFHKIQGNGNFSTSITPAGLSIKIKKESGFFMDKVVVRISDANPPCDAIEIGDVLKGG